MCAVTLAYLLNGRTPPGVRELKPFGRAPLYVHDSRTPPGVRELKHVPRGLYRGLSVSHPSRGA